MSNGKPDIASGAGAVTEAPKRVDRAPRTGLSPAGASASEPYFRPDSMYARLWAQRAPYIGLPRMILVEGAHPLVYSGIIGHSAYQGEAFAARLMRTGKMFRTLAHAPRATSDRLLEVVHEMHGRVRGKLKYDDGGPRYPKGTPFAAMDPSLLLWVLHGVFESFELGYDMFVRRLTPEEKEEHWQDWRLAGKLFGLRDDEMPRTRAEVEAYAREMYETDRTVVTEAARKKAVGFVIDGIDVDAGGKSTVAWYERPGFQLLKSFTLTTLPDRIREQYGLPTSPARAAATKRFAAISRRMNPHLGRLVMWPEAYGKAKGAAWNEVQIKARPDGSRIILDA